MLPTASGFLQPQQIRCGINSLNTKVGATKYAMHLLIADAHTATLAFDGDAYMPFKFQESMS